MFNQVETEESKKIKAIKTGADSRVTYGVGGNSVIGGAQSAAENLTDTHERK